jgi:DNA-binding transcriptional MerR regulator
VTLHELLDKAGLNARTLRHWTQKGLMPRTTDGHYTDADLTRALAICRMRYQDGVHSLDEVAARLSALSPEQMERYALEEDGAGGEVGGAATATTPAPTTTVAPPVAARELPAEATAPLRHEWSHVTLRPGLVLLVRQPPGDEARSLARKILTISDVDASFD